MSPRHESAVWFPTVRTGTGTDVFTERLAAGLIKRGIRAEITWLPLRSEYAPWTVKVPRSPEWATVIHVNTWLRARFMTDHVPVVATIHHAAHHPDLRVYKGSVRSAYHRWWIAPNERRVLRRSNSIVAVSQFAAETAKAFLTDLPMHIIYNGVDTNRYRPTNRPRQPRKPFRLLYVGSWKKLKGVDLLAPIMRELGEDFELRYTGGEAAEPDKQTMPPNMHDIGRLNSEDAVIKTMQSADALLFPSRSEGHPLVVIEAMACGLPVIATRGSSLVEVVENYVTGLLCTPDDVHEFAIAAHSLSADQALCERMARAARTGCEQRYSLSTMLDSYLGVYAGLN